MAPQEAATATEVSIVLADDHQVVRQGLRALFAAEPGFRVVGDAAGGKEAVRLVKALEPAVLVLDLAMPDMSGLDVAQELAEDSGTAIVVFSMHTSVTYVVEAMRTGVTGYVTKDAPADELVHAVRLAAHGERYLSSGLDKTAIEAQLATDVAATAPWGTLTPREREIVRLVADGLTSSQIGERLGISVRTAEKHRANLMKKLGLRTPAQLVRHALERAPAP